MPETSLKRLKPQGMGSKWRLLESFAEASRRFSSPRRLEALKERCDVACLDAYDPSASLPSFLRQLLAAEGLHRGAVWSQVAVAVGCEASRRWRRSLRP